MHSRTHVVFAFLLGLLGISYLNPRNQILFITLVILGSLLPDIDHPDSKVGRKVKIIAFLFEHRGFFHSIILLAIVNAIFWWYSNITIYLIAFNIGYVSHILLDAFNHQGIMPFHPFSKKKIKGVLKSDGLVEQILFILILCATIYKLVNL